MRRSYLSFSLLLLLVISCKNSGSGPESTSVSRSGSKPNIVYILADDLGYGDLSFLGQEKFRTPQIDRMAEEGMVFTQHYAGSTVCSPSRAVLFTGMHTGHAPIRGNFKVDGGDFPMPESAYLLPEMLKEQGYVTGAFGKWGMGFAGSSGSPEKCGIDEWYGYVSQTLAHNYYPENLWHNTEKIILEGNLNGGEKEYSFDLIHKAALDFIDANKDTTFFLYLPYTIPHAELKVPDDSIFRKFKGMFPEFYYQGVDDGPKFRKGPYCSQEFPHATFAAMVTRLDLAVGDILNKLEELGLDGNTLVIFTSDNGPHEEGGADPQFFNSSGPYRGLKRDLYEGGIHVPAIAWWPGVVKAGTHSDLISAFWDVFPTCADLAGSEVPENVDGISLVPVLTGSGEQQLHDHLYWEFHERQGRIAVRKGEWKAVKYQVNTNPDAAIELYNLKNDPGETKDLAGEYPELVREMDSIMKVSRTHHAIWDFSSGNS